MSLRRAVPVLIALVLLGAAALAFAVTRPTAAEGVQLGANGCPPGFTSREERMSQERRMAALERVSPTRSEGPGDERLGGDVGADGPLQRIAREPACMNRKSPEAQGELMAIQENDKRRSTGGVTDTLKPGAYRAAQAERRAIAAEARTLPGSAGDWKPAGQGPLIADDPRFDEVNGLGLADLNGRISDFARDPATGRIFAAVGEGGVWQSDDGGQNWRSIGDTLPTQAVGGIEFSPADGGTIIITTGDNVFGGGGTFAGAGAFRTTNGGQSWQRASGVPDGIITFKVAVDPVNPRNVYAATGAGLFRSSDAGVTFNNVNLPTGRAGGQRSGAPLDPDCTGAAPTKVGCFLANMVTDVVVQGPDNAQTPDSSPGAKAGSVVAVVGWRAGNKKSPPSEGFPQGYVESPNNGVYRSDTGDVGSFDKLRNEGNFFGQDHIGRIELGLATGAKQDHNYLYAIVEDAQRFNGGAPVLDAPDGGTGPATGNTVLNGIFVSSNFGTTWTLMENADELANDLSSGSALNGTGTAIRFSPGIQAWYNEWIEPDPTSQTTAGVPTRLAFGLEEIWQNKVVGQPQSGKSQFKVVGPYFSGESCLFLDTGRPVCPTTAGNPTTAAKTTHPDQQAGMWVAGDADGKATLIAGHDGGVNTQGVQPNADINPDGWGRGANGGFNTLLPYDAQVSKDGTIYAGLQDNGELKIEPDGRQFMTFGGDGAFSAVEPDNSKVAYEGLPGGAMNKTINGGESYSDVSPPDDTYQFINPFTMDPLDPKHLITAGTSVYETLDGAESYEEVFDLGAAPASRRDALGNDSISNRMSAIDVRSVPEQGKDASAAYVGYCGFCDPLNTRPFDNGVATNVAPGGSVGKKGTGENWRMAKAVGLPKRYITSIQADPVDPKTVYVTVAGYSRRWLPVGVLGEDVTAAQVGKGNVFKSTDAGQTFQNISGNMPDVPANWTTVRNGQLVVATNAGVYVSAGTDGGAYELLGEGLPNAPVFTLEMKPKASASEPDTLIAATQGRGVYRYEFKDPAGTTAGTRPGTQSGPGSGGGPTPTACTASTGFKSVSAARAGSGVRLAFTRNVTAPVRVDVFRVSQGRRVLKERLVARFENRAKSFVWNGVTNRGGAKRKAGTGYYFVRYTMLRGGKRIDVRRVTLRRSGGRFSRRPDYYRRDTCDLLGKFKLERPVFGGSRTVALKAAYRLNSAARVTVTITKGSKVVKRYKATQREGKRTYRVTLPARRRAGGDYRVRLQATGGGGQRVNAVLTSRRL